MDFEHELVDELRFEVLDLSFDVNTVSRDFGFEVDMENHLDVRGFEVGIPERQEHQL